MPFPSVTYTFVGEAIISPTETNTNNNDFVMGFSDGAEDFSMNTGTLAGNLTVNGNATLGSDSADTVTVNATFVPATLTLDNSTTHGGRVQFNGATTSYVGSSADGTTLSVAGFTALSYPTTLEIAGQKMVLSLSMPDDKTRASGDTYLGVTSSSYTGGFEMTRAGSIVGLGVGCVTTAHTSNGTFTISARINGTNKITSSTLTASSAGQQHADFQTAARGTYPFVAGDAVQLYLDFGASGTYTLGDFLCYVEVYLDT